MRAAAALALACAACGPSAYACTEHQQCAIDELVGVCQADGFCSFPDDGCPSGQRYGEHGGPMAGQCVPVADDTGTDSSGGTSTAATTSSTTTTATTTTVTVTESTSSSTDPATTTSATDLTTSESTGVPIDPEPLLWFSFDEVGADGIPNLGSLGGIAMCSDATCPLPTEGAVGAGVIFDGLDDCAIFDHVPELGDLDALTISAWLLREEVGVSYDCVLCKPVGDLPWNSWRLATYDDKNGAVADFRVGLADNMGMSIPAAIPLAAWTHIVGTWDGATMALWVDGESIIESPNALYEFDEQPVYLGCDDDHAKIGITNFLAGSVDEVRFYARALGDDEIAVLFAEGM